MKRRFFPVALAFALLTGFAVQAQAKCGCFQDWKQCVKKQVQSEGVSFEVCGDELDRCVTKCSNVKECKADCKAMKDDSKKICEDTFKSWVCGGGDKKCEKNRKKALKSCKKSARKDARRCKKDCKP